MPMTEQESVEIMLGSGLFSPPCVVGAVFRPISRIYTAVYHSGVLSLANA